MTVFILTAEFVEELESTKDDDPPAYDAALVLLLELQGNADLLNYVPHQHFDYQPMFEIKRFRDAYADGYDINIVKFYDFNDLLVPFRILVCYDPTKDTHYALSYPPRKWDYSVGDSRYQELVDRYVKCGIPQRNA